MCFSLRTENTRVSVYLQICDLITNVVAISSSVRRFLINFVCCSHIASHYEPGFLEVEISGLIALITQTVKCL